MKKFTLNTFIFIYAIAIVVGIVNLCFMSVFDQKANTHKDSFFSNFTSSLIAEEKDPDIGLIRIFGTIQPNADSSFMKQNGALYWKKQLEIARTDPNLKAVLIQVNSPGGTVGATQELYDEIMKIKESGKLVVVSMYDLAASGGYYLSSAADYIFANAGTLTGSIGVIISSPNLKLLFDKIGISFNVIKSGKNKDILSTSKDMTPEQEEILKSIVMDSYDSFVTAVATGRNLTKEEVYPYADGRVLSAKQALDAKLIDEIGTSNDAIEYIEKTLNISNATVKTVEDDTDIFQFLKMSMSSFFTNSNLLEQLEMSSGIENKTPILYLYKQ